MSWIDRLQSCVRGARGWRRHAIAFAAGAFSVLALAPFQLWPVLFLTLPVLVWLIDGCFTKGSDPLPSLSRASRHVSCKGSDPIIRKGLSPAFSAGWWFGFGYFVFGLFWVGEAFLVEAEKYALLIPFAVTLLPAGLAIFWGAATLLARAFWSPGIARILVLAVTLSAAEWLRGHVLSGFPWNILGYALTTPLELMQSASVIGTYGLTLWTVLIASAPLVLAADAAAGADRRRGLLTGSAIAVLPLLAAAVFGAGQLAREPVPDIEGVRLRIVQASVPQKEKWRPENQGPIFRDQLDLSRRDASGRVDDLAGITHVIWPEAAMPFLPLENPGAIAAIGETLPAGTYLLSGGLRVAKPQQNDEVLASGDARRVYNSLMVFGTGGGLAALYDKNHLVPFGEYLPLRPLFNLVGMRGLTEMRGAFTSGLTPRPLLDIPGLPKAGALVCYEAIFPGEIVQGPERPGVLINITNDGWFGNSTGPRQHFHQARVRAVEEGLPLVRAANNGISGIVDPRGRVLARLELNARGVIDSGLPGASAPTPYGRFGDWIFALNALVFAFAASRLAR